MKRIGMVPSEWIQAFLDENSFDEFLKDNAEEIIGGVGKYQGRKVIVYAHNPKAGQGFITSKGAEKICLLMDKSRELKVPIISFMASPGVSVQEGIASGNAYTKVIAKTIELSGHVPQIAVVIGLTMGAPAYSATLMDFVIFNKVRSTLMVTGPEVIKKVMGQVTTIKDLGGSEVHLKKTGIADFVGKNINEQIEILKKLMSFLPANVEIKPEKTTEIKPKESTLKVPDSPFSAFNIKDFINGLVDGSDFFEIKASFASSLVTGFARVGGNLVGIVANQSKKLAGSIDYLAARKGARFIRLCDSFNIPLLTLIDVPGFMPGEDQEHNGLLRYGAQFCQSMQTTTPRLSVVVRRCYGAAAFLMMQTKSQGGDIVLALEEARIGIMGYAGAKTMIYPDDGKNRSKEYYENYEDPKIALEQGIVDEIVKAESLRARLIELIPTFLEKKYPKQPLKKQLSLP